MGFSNQYQTVSEAYPSQTTKTELFVKIVLGWNLLTISAKNSTTDVRICSKYISDFNCNQSLDWQSTNISKTHKKSTKNQSVTEWYKRGKSGIMNSVCVAMKSKPWNILNYWVWDTMMWMQSFREFKGPSTLLNLNTCTIFRTHADLGLCNSWDGGVCNIS